MEGRTNNTTLFALVWCGYARFVLETSFQTGVEKTKNNIIWICPCSLDGTFVYIFIHAL